MIDRVRHLPCKAFPRVRLAALVDELRRGGERVALVELDEIAEMALPTLPSWDHATRIFAMVTGAWARSALTCVIAEGISRQDEVLILLDQVPEEVVTITVAMTTPFEAALPRAQLTQHVRSPAIVTGLLSVIKNGRWRVLG